MSRSLTFFLMTAIVASCMFLTACGHRKVKYSVNLAAHYEVRTEKYEQGLDSLMSDQLLETVTIVSGDNNQIKSIGKGFKIGLTEETYKTIMSSEVNFFYILYDSVQYTFNTASAGNITQTLTPSAYGLDAKIGFNLGIFRPQFSYRFGTFAFTSKVSGSGTALEFSGSNSLYVLGGGLAIRIPIGKSLKISLQGDYQVPLRLEAGVSVNTYLVQAGIEIHAFDVEYK